MYHSRFSVLFAVILLAAGSVHAVPYANFDIGPNTQRVEPGFTGLIAAPADGANGTAYPSTAYVSLTGDSFNVAISSVDWRDRGDSTNGAQSLVQLGEDHVKNNAGDITVTLASLPAGTYTVTSYHKDPGFSQSSRIQVFVSDALGSERLQPTRGNAGVNTALNSLTTADVTASAAGFSFVSNGVNPVTLRFNGSGADTESPLNGIQLDHISAVPTLLNYAVIDVGPTGQRVEPGALGVSGAANNANNVNLAPLALVSNTGDAFTIAINNLDQANAAVGAIDWRDRGDSVNGAQPLVQLGEDFVKNNAGVIRMTLDGIAAGTYLIESYHEDPDNAQSTQIDVFVTDANGTMQALISGLDGQTDVGANVTEDMVRTSAAAFMVTSNGVSPIVLIFDGRASADDETPFNGLRISQLVAPSVPEPVTGTLLMLAAGTLLRRRRRLA